jgi:hypothetical protein
MLIEKEKEKKKPFSFFPSTKKYSYFSLSFFFLAANA